MVLEQRSQHASEWATISSIAAKIDCTGETLRHRVRQQHHASGLNLLVTAIILWKTRYLERAVATLRQTKDVANYLLAHLSPLCWEHVNLTGGYISKGRHRTSENTNELGPLRTLHGTGASFPRAM
jgi:hypothetical protein